MKKPIFKEALTVVFLRALDYSTDKTNVEFYFREWWNNSRRRKPNRLRLTDKGRDMLINQLEMVSYQLPLPVEYDQHPQVLLFLEKYLDCPYYIESRKLILFNAKTFFELNLFSDDLRKYGVSKAVRINRARHG